MPIHEGYNSFKVRIILYKNKQVVKRANPRVGDWRTAYALADKLKRQWRADDYQVLKDASDSDQDIINKSKLD